MWFLEFKFIIISISVGFLLDLLFGDPQWFPHPVRIIGFFIERLEKIVRRIFTNLRLGGYLLAIIIIFSTYATVFLMIYFANKISYKLSLILSCFLIYTTISIKDLKTESMRVYEALKRNDLKSARKYLSMIVGRDTQNLPLVEIIRATVETIAESIVDGIISPLFYAFLGGAPLAMTYKAISTLDSMIGYQNEKYKDLGFLSAKLDDIANFIPARVSIVSIAIASLIKGYGFSNSFKIALRDGKNSPSPNSGIPEAAMAGALGVRLGGINYYGGIPKLKYFIGDFKRELNKEDIIRANDIMYISAFFSFLLFFVLYTIVKLIL